MKKIILFSLLLFFLIIPSSYAEDNDILYLKITEIRHGDYIQGLVFKSLEKCLDSIIMEDFLLHDVMVFEIKKIQLKQEERPWTPKYPDYKRKVWVPVNQERILTPEEVEERVRLKK